MADRDAIESELQESLEVLETGRWYIAEGEYDGLASAAQGESRQEAVQALVKRFYEREQNEERRQAEKERIEAEMERRRELSDARMERALDQEIELMERELERLEE